MAVSSPLGSVLPSAKLESFQQRLQLEGLKSHVRTFLNPIVAGLGVDELLSKCGMHSFEV